MAAYLRNQNFQAIGLNVKNEKPDFFESGFSRYLSFSFEYAHARFRTSVEYPFVFDEVNFILHRYSYTPLVINKHKRVNLINLLMHLALRPRK